MQRRLTKQRRSDLERIKEGGLTLDFDEIARRGSMSEEESQIAKWYGVYNMRLPGTHMVRVVLPGGVFTSAQARAMARLSESYGQGVISFTTRQSAQYHWIKPTQLPNFLRDLRRAGLSSFHGCGDVNRNTAACPWATTCPHRRLDVLPFAQETARHLAECRDLDNLPRKFKVSYSGCAAGCAQPHINDVGVIAIVRRGPNGAEETGFRVVIGGGQGWKPFVAQPLFGFVPREKILPVCRAVALLFRDHGDRWNRATSRLKFVVERMHVEGCRQIVLDHLRREGVGTGDLEVEAAEDIGPRVPRRPLTERSPVGTDGKAIVRVRIPTGELRFTQLRRLAELSEIYGDKTLTTTNRQNLELHGVSPEQVSALEAEIVSAGLPVDGHFGLKDVVPCVGTTYCPLAVSRTRDMHDLLQAVVENPKYATIENAAVINVTGCPNSCSPYHIADIGLRGMEIREAEGCSEGYEIRIGGTQQQFGQRLGEFKNPDCIRVVARVLDRFLELRQGDETLAGSVRRLGIEPYAAAVAALGIRYDMAPNPAEYSGRAGAASTALDLATIAKDVPCQPACPAHTDIPAYIEKISQGRLDDAYLINQESNVFPGVLGRICTAPCEDRCRHNWTGIEGPVSIKHLKRSAADGKSSRARPLHPHFAPTGRRVAIIGGGPCGLTAARELQRLGHRVVVYEREQRLGGMLEFGIPVFRLPRAVVEEEVAAIVDAGIDVELGADVDAARLAEILAAHDAVLVAAGALEPVLLDLPGLPSGVAVPGLEFLMRYNRGDPLPLTGDVLIIGGGFTSIDCVRAARRQLGDEGSLTVIMYRRTEAEMPASRHELEELAEEGCDIETLFQPVSARTQDGLLRGITFRRNQLGPAEPGKKPEIIPIPNSEFEVECQTVIFALGQRPASRLLPGGVTITGRHTTSHPKLFVAGDFSGGSSDVITAVAEGKSACRALDEHVTGSARRDVEVMLQAVPEGETGRLRDDDLVVPPGMPTLPVAGRWSHGEVETGFTADEAKVNADRCYLCNYKYEIDQDKCIHCDWCIKVSPRECIRKLKYLFRDEDGAPTNYVETTVNREATYIWIDSDNCVRCGNCLRVCPTEAISLTRGDRIETPDSSGLIPLTRLTQRRRGPHFEGGGI